MSDTILTAENLKFRYDAEQPVYALDGVSVQVKRGEFVAVLGANGCGKSTLAKHFNAILLPESGKVYVEGMDTANEEKLYDIRQTVGMVFQNPDNQIVATVVEEDVAFALENLGVPQDEMRRRVDDSMKMAGIYEYRERAPHNLSGGQKQRVAIAGVVAMRPDCLILDEATAMLDPRGREQVMQTIHYLNRNMGITVVSITHYMEEAAQADRVLVMSKGHVVMEGTPKEVFSQTEKVRSLHLDVPQEEMRRRVDDSMKMAGIYEYRERAPHNLSGGQKQRVAIAGVVAMRPDCLILDEATAMLDPRGREQVMQTIHYLNRNMGITVVSITHYMEEAAQADRVLVMSKGHVVMEGTPKEVFSQTEKVRSLHLDVPQAAELRDELVKAGISMPEGIIDTGACAQALYELLQ